MGSLIECVFGESTQHSYWFSNVLVKKTTKKRVENVVFNLLQVFLAACHSASIILIILQFILA